MNIIATDDEAFALNAVCRVIKEAVPEAELHRFEDTEELITDIRDNGFCPDVAFLDIEMPGMNGLELAGYMKTLYPKVNIVFVTGFSQYALDALKLRPSGYLTKPVSKEDILEEIQNLRTPPERTQPAKPAFMHCFGNFELLHNGKPVAFPRTKCLEMLAYLVDRQGSNATTPEIADALWEDGVYDRRRQKHISAIRNELIKTLEEHGIGEIMKVSRTTLSVDPDTFDCDYYMMLAGDNVMLNRFHGEYMTQYTWAEETRAALSGKFVF